MLTKIFYRLERALLLMRMFKFFICLLTFISLITTPSFAVEVPAIFSFHGSGYGHGVGMSQIGARAMAIAGRSPAEIIQYYYKDVSIQPLADNQNLRINLGHLLTSAKVTSLTNGAQLQLFSGDVGEGSDITPIATFSSKSNISFAIIGSTVSPTLTIGKSATIINRSRTFTLRWSGTRYLSGTDSVISLTHSGSTKKYRYGQLQFKAVKAPDVGYRIEITNTLRLHDEYLWGIGEVPTSWPMAALVAQVIASRTYALSKAGIIRADCDCDLYGATQDQSFLGYGKEIEVRYGAIWKAAVSSSWVNDESGLAITISGKPIRAYFFSSSAGITESALNAWGTDLAYTVSVLDPASNDLTLNPRYVSWNREVTQSVIAAAFILPDVISLEIISKNQTGSVAQIKAVSSTGVEVILRGDTFRSRTKIPSPWFELVSVQN